MLETLDPWNCHTCGWSGDEPEWEVTVDWVPRPFGPGDVPMETREPHCPMGVGHDVREGDE